MKRALFALILLTCLVELARADFCSNEEWTTWDKALGTTAAIAEIADWRQTQIIAKNPQNFREMNPVLGDHPSMGKVNRYFLLSGLTIAFIADCLPSNYRKWYLGTVTVVEIQMSRHNYGLGIRFGF